MLLILGQVANPRHIECDDANTAGERVRGEQPAATLAQFTVVEAEPTIVSNQPISKHKEMFRAIDFKAIQMLGVEICQPLYLGDSVIMIIIILLVRANDIP